MRRNSAIRKTDEAPQVRCRLPLRDANDIVLSRNSDGCQVIRLKGFLSFDFGIEIDRAGVARRLADMAVAAAEALEREERLTLAAVGKRPPKSATQKVAKRV